MTRLDVDTRYNSAAAHSPQQIVVAENIFIWLIKSCFHWPQQTVAAFRQRKLVYMITRFYAMVSNGHSRRLSNFANTLCYAVVMPPLLPPTSRLQQRHTSHQYCDVQISCSLTAVKNQQQLQQCFEWNLPLLCHLLVGGAERCSSIPVICSNILALVSPVFWALEKGMPSSN